MRRRGVCLATVWWWLTMLLIIGPILALAAWAGVHYLIP